MRKEKSVTTIYLRLMKCQRRWQKTKWGNDTKWEREIETGGELHEVICVGTRAFNAWSTQGIEDHRWLSSIQTCEIGGDKRRVNTEAMVVKVESTEVLGDMGMGEVRHKQVENASTEQGFGYQGAFC